MVSERKARRVLEEGPIILHSPGDGSYLPDSIKRAVVLARQTPEALEDAKRGLCTYADALAYISDASLKIPLNGDYAAIFFWLAKKVLGITLPGAEIPDELPPHLEAELTRLRERIFRAQLRAVSRSGARAAVERS